MNETLSKTLVLCGKPSAENPFARFDGGAAAVASLSAGSLYLQGGSMRYGCNWISAESIFHFRGGEGTRC